VEVLKVLLNVDPEREMNIYIVYSAESLTLLCQTIAKWMFHEFCYISVSIKFFLALASACTSLYMPQRQKVASVTSYDTKIATWSLYSICIIQKPLIYFPNMAQEPGPYLFVEYTVTVHDDDNNYSSFGLHGP
jgi:hypothetical protein